MNAKRVFFLFVCLLVLIPFGIALGNRTSDGDKPQPKVTVCQKTGNGSYHAITISANAWANHHRVHPDDFVVDDAHPCPPGAIKVVTQPVVTQPVVTQPVVVVPSVTPPVVIVPTAVPFPTSAPTPTPTVVPLQDKFYYYFAAAFGNMCDPNSYPLPWVCTVIPLSQQANPYP